MEKHELYTPSYQGGAYPAEYVLWQCKDGEKPYVSKSTFRKLLALLENDHPERAIWNILVSIYLVDLLSNTVWEVRSVIDHKASQPLARMRKSDQRTSKICDFIHSTHQVININDIDPRFARELLCGARNPPSRNTDPVKQWLERARLDSQS